MVDLLGLSDAPEHHVGQPAAEYFYGDAGQETINAKCQREDKSFLGIEKEMTFRDGATRFLRIDASVIRDLDGHPVGAMTLAADLTDIKAQQRQIEAQQAKTTETAKAADEIANRLSTATEELSAQVEQSSQGAQLQSKRVAATATAMEEMNATVLEVAKNASQAADTSDKARNKAQEGADIVRRGGPGHRPGPAPGPGPQVRHDRTGHPGPGHRTDHERDLRHRRPDQPAGPERGHRGPPGPGRPDAASPWWPTRCASWPRRP